MEPSLRAKHLRILVTELERLHSHILTEAVMSEILGFNTLFMYIMKAKEILTDARVIADHRYCYVMCCGYKIS